MPQPLPVTPCPDSLRAAYDWTHAAGEIAALAALTGEALTTYCAESAANAGEHGEAITASDLAELADWLRAA